jgi:hypothetical protein
LFAGNMPHSPNGGPKNNLVNHRSSGWISESNRRAKGLFFK